jgi:hypothetical protein
MQTIIRRTSAVALVLSLLCAAPRPAAALEMGLELEIGTSIPLASFPDGVPVAIDDTSGAFLGTPNSAYNLLLDGTTSAGFSTALSLLLGNWYIRAAFSYNVVTSAKFTHFAVRRFAGQDLPENLHNIYVGTLDREAELPETSSVLTARLGFGRRWYLLGEGLFRPYLMMGLGALLAVVEGVVDPGMTFHVGLGTDIYLGLGFDLGVKVYYEWMGVILPDNFQASSAGNAVSTTATAETSVFEAFLESMHTLQLTVSATYRF